MVLRSSEMPPFSSVGISAATNGTMLPFSSKRASGSITRLAASMSLVPLDRNGFMIDTACQ
jgi:hypothetical protein